MYRLALTIAFVLVLWLAAAGDTPSSGNLDLQSRIEYAERLYADSDYAGVSEILADLIALNPSYDGIPRLKILEAKARYFAGERERAGLLFEEFITEEKGTSYKPACYFFLGRIAFDRNDFLESADRFLSAYDATDDPELRELCLINSKNLCIGYLSDTEQRAVLTACYRTDQSLFSELTYRIAEEYSSLELHRKAERIVDIHHALAGRDDARINELAHRINVSLSRSLDIALLVPLSGDLAAYGRQMDAAADLAVRIHGGADADIKFKSYDTFGNSIVAAQLSRNILSAGVSAVIGPLTSHEAVGAAPYSDFWSVPMILPAASEKGLTSVSDRVFQLSPTPEAMGRRLAEAAMEELGLDSVAILSPNDSYGRQITEGFKQVIREYDVEIFSEIYFTQGSSDYRRFMLNIKEAVLPDSFDSTIFLDEKGDTLETEEIEVHIPAMFIPAFAEDLRFIIPQLRFYRIHTIVLGGEDLGNEDIVALKPTSLYPTMFVSHATFTEADTAWQRFSYLMKQESGSEATPVAGLTYDAVRMTIEAAELGGYSPEGIARGWKKLGRVDGLTGPFEFNERNENTSVPVYIILDGRIEQWPH